MTNNSVRVPPRCTYILKGNSQLQGPLIRPFTGALCESGPGPGGPCQPFVALRAGPGLAQAPNKLISMMQFNNCGSENVNTKKPKHRTS